MTTDDFWTEGDTGEALRRELTTYLAADVDEPKWGVLHVHDAVARRVAQTGAPAGSPLHEHADRDAQRFPHQQCVNTEPHVGHRHVNEGPRGGCGLPEWCPGVHADRDADNVPSDELRRAVLLWAQRFEPGDRWDPEDMRDLHAALMGTVEAYPTAHHRRQADNVPSDRVRAYAEAVHDVIADHPMWIGDDSQPLDYNPDRDARIVDFTEETARAVMAVADREQAALRSQKALATRLYDEAEAENERLRAGLYPLNQHTPESALALAEDIGATEDSLLVQWVRRGQAIARVEALHRPTRIEEEGYDRCAEDGYSWPCATVRALRGPVPTEDGA